MSGAVRLRFSVPIEQEETLAGWLWSAGGAGLELDPEPAGGRLTGWLYFDEEAAPDAGARATFAAWCAGGTLGAAEPVAGRDWLEPWRTRSGPIEIGDRFLVDPREPEEVGAPYDPGDRFLLRLPARTAFGVGSHESTRLALELLEETGCAGLRVLDVGCGTGILAFAAHRLGASQVVAFDVDPAAALLVRQYGALNGGPPVRVFAGSLAAVSIAGAGSDSIRFDLALVNVIPDEIGGDLPGLRACLGERARALFSGILLDQEEAAKRRITSHGFRPRGRRVEGEWVALAMEVDP